MYIEQFHKFSNNELAGITLPSLFTYPFHYTPHPLCIKAQSQVLSYIDSHPEWHKELNFGKMLGVLIVRNGNDIGFLAAFSGNLAGSNNHPYFVPAVYDLLSEKGFFRQEENLISEINRQINDEINSPERKAIIDKLSETEHNAKVAIDNYKCFMKQSKNRRDELRKQGTDNITLIAESQFQKAELKRLQNNWKQKIDSLQDELSLRDNQVTKWKIERQHRSVELQEKIFHHFIMLNAQGERQDLCEIFATTSQYTPPAGAGECAAPKLLQYAYINGLTPLSMAEFWVGKSPKDTIRRHGNFYPSCTAKCKPILNFMLKGLNVEPNPLETTTNNNLDIIYEDDWILVVDKPAGVLSVPGKLSTDSIQEQVQRLYSDSETPIIVHRLDMATSGLLIFAKTIDVYKKLQSMFKNRKIQKRYIAILDGSITHNHGEINLPLILNPKERPLQVVNHTLGKPAITQYEVIERKEGKTRIAFYPITGRTHQLRVHSAHPEGLNTPIMGDTLYGTYSDRLYLHAETLSFTHPISGKEIHITTPCPF